MRDKIIIPKNASMEKRTEIFIYKANLVHNNQYDYSKTKYINNRSHVTIICKKHGEFNQVANTHLRGAGCFQCGLKKAQKHNNRLSEKTKEKFIEDAIKIHGNKYDYSKFEYTLCHDKGIIICPVHGEFLKSQNKHILRKSGCPECSKQSTISKGETIISDFLKENNIAFEYNYKLTCEKVNKMPYDFFIKEFNLLIEFDGEQHFKKKFNMTDEDFKRRIEIDSLKEKVAESLGYSFLRINYRDNIEKSLRKYLKVQRLSKPHLNDGRE